MISGYVIIFDKWDSVIFKEVLKRKRWLTRRLEYFKRMVPIYNVFEEIREYENEFSWLRRKMEMTVW